MKTISLTPPPGWRAPESAHFAPESPLGHSATVIPTEAIEALEAVNQRKCAACGDSFDAVGLTALCDPCGIKVDEQAALPPVRKLDSTWPKLHAEKLDSLHGPALVMAQKLAPKLFGNRLLVLAGDRGRGKTQIATFIAFYRLTKGHDSGIYTRAFDMVRMCDGYSEAARKSLLAFQKVPFLCVDECHRLEPRYIQAAESILDARYSNKRPTMLIGNWMTPEGMESGEEVSGQKLNGLGATLMDRVNEHTVNKTGGVVWCRWNSYRK
jgi:DNA replication protein DnaC